ncbi:MAG TPA: hypothetical protein DEP42_02080 [Ruminococcaceae bacterium]|nr:hypothetical protein [Oscillospiraceae bacterium]
MFNIAIYYDDLDDAEQLEKVIRNYLDTSAVLYHIFKFSRDEKDIVGEAIPHIEMLFLDIHVKNRERFEKAKFIRENNRGLQIVFVVDDAKYRDMALSVHAFGYLVRPYTAEQIAKQIQDMLSFQEEIERPQITLQTDSGACSFYLKTICYFEYQNNKLKMVETGGVHDVIGFTLKSLRDVLRAHGFAMPHKSYLTNYLYVSKCSSYQIHMKNGDTIPLSPGRASEFKAGFCQAMSVYQNGKDNSLN